MLTEREYEVLGKYLRGRVVDEEDLDTVYFLAGIGLLRLGFTTKGGIKPTTKATPIGKDEYIDERRRRSRFYRILYALLHPTL